jgi:hypothetical protein
MTSRKAVAMLMGLESASLAVMSALHLTGALSGKPGSSAGIPEALICVALAAGTEALVRRRPHARPLATGTLVFAIAGFLVGLSFTLSGNSAVDLAYHATVLPLLVLTLAMLRRSRAASRP